MLVFGACFVGNQFIVLPMNGNYHVLTCQPLVSSCIWFMLHFPTSLKSVIWVVMLTICLRLSKLYLIQLNPMIAFNLII